LPIASLNITVSRSPRRSGSTRSGTLQRFAPSAKSGVDRLFARQAPTDAISRESPRVLNVGKVKTSRNTDEKVFAARAARLPWRLFVCLVACIAPALCPGAELLPRSVLYLDQNDPGEPIAVGMSAAFRSTINPGGDANITIYAENLDLIRSPGPRHQEGLKTYLREKYRDRPIGVIVAMGTMALPFMLRVRAELWSEVPAVFAAGLSAETKIPPGVTGLDRRQTLRATVSLARALMPGVKRIALVGDVPKRIGDDMRARFNEEVPALAAEVETIDLRGLRIAELRQRVAALPDNTVIYFTTMTYEGDKPVYVSRDALVDLSQVANRPIIVDLEGHVDAGVVGGLVADPTPIGRGAARLALRILDGENASNIPVVTGDFVRPIFDARQLQRWGISENNLPPGSEIRFRRPTAWEQYHWQIMLIGAALLLQSGLIIGLFYEHRRRRHAEMDARHRLSELAQVNRSATAGQLSASIAHEINQPLTAIVANGYAVVRLLSNAAPNLGEAQAALKRIINDGHRASEVIGSIRAMFKKDAEARVPVDVNELIRDILALVRGQIDAQQVQLNTQLIDPLPQIVANRVQLQQVILNLVMNAIEAMSSVTDRPRVLRISSEIHNPLGLVVTVEDSGTGIDPQNRERVFDAFFTTKSNGMGMGLSICRSIVEAHGGRLSVSPSQPHGSAFQVVLPVG
jgi:signal transduction histidine kinase